LEKYTKIILYVIVNQSHNKVFGLGYDEVKLGDKFIRIGEGFLEKDERLEYDYHSSYKLVDNG
jgi:hypothetical protein